MGLFVVKPDKSSIINMEKGERKMVSAYISKTMKRAGVCACFFALFAWGTGIALALPEGGQVESGTATFVSSNPTTLDITVSDNAVLNFKLFNIGQNETVNFIQSNSAASVLSRVVGGQASIIAGLLTATGNLFLVNPNGINFTSTAQVRANSLVASTLDISTNNFINGNYLFEKNLNSPYSQILNQGRITANNIALIASSVNNTGVIVAKAGTAHLASGDKTTVSFDSRGLIQIEINSETSAKVIDLKGVTVKDAVANSGTIEAGEVMMTAETAEDIFEMAVNQTGIVRATGIAEQNGAIKIIANGSVQVSGGLIVSKNAVTVPKVKVSSGRDVLVDADLTVENADLELLADNNLDGIGAFKQAAGTVIKTLNFGDIAIQASGASTLANIISAGSLILKQAGSAAIFNQHPNSYIITRGSLFINPGVTLNAANARYTIGRDWINQSNFLAGTSMVSLVSSLEAMVLGANTFYDLIVIEPAKIVRFDTESTQTIMNLLILKGSYGKLLVLDSIEPSKQWKINPLGQTDIQFALIANAINIRGPPLKAIHSSSAGNLTNFDLDPFWTGQGLTSNWSDADNWDTGTVPTAFDIITFDGITGSNPNKDSILDAGFHGTIDSLTLNGYTGKLTLARDLILSGDFNHQTGVLDPVTYTVTFIDASKTSHITGNTTFYNLTCLTPGKKLVFQANSLTTVTNTLAIEGSSEAYVILDSSLAGEGNEFQMYINAVSDKEGNAYLQYIEVNNSIALGPVIPIVCKNERVAGRNNTQWDATYYWVGDTDGAVWNDSTHWSASSGGGGGAGVPGTGDTAIFDGGNSNGCAINVTLVGAIDIQSGYGGTVSFSNSLTVEGAYSQAGGVVNVSSSYRLTTGAFNISGGTFATVSTIATKLVCTSFTQSGGAFTNTSFVTVDINGNFSMTDGTFSNGGRTNVSGNFSQSGGTFTSSGTGSNYGFYFDGNSASFDTATSFADVKIAKTAGQTLTLNVNLTTGSFKWVSGGFDTNGNTLILSSTNGYLSLGSNTIGNVRISGNPTYCDNYGTISGTLTIDASRALTITSGVTLSLASTATLVLSGTISQTVSNGTLELVDGAGANLPTGGTLSARVRFTASTGNVIVPARTYGSRVTFYNNTVSNYTATLGTDVGQTLTFSENFYIEAASTGNMAVSAATNNPTINITGILDFTGAGDGSESLTMGSSTWTVSGNVDFTNGTVTAGSSTLIMNATKTLTTAGQTLNNFTAKNTSSSNLTVTVSGDFTLSGNLLVQTTSSGTMTLDFASNDPAAAITGGVSYSKSSTGTPSISMGDGIWSVKGDFNLTNGTLAANSSTLTLNGAAAQTVTSNSQTLNAVIVTNVSAGGVTFADRLQCATFTDTTTNSKIYFSAATSGAPHTVSTTLTLTGAAGSMITLGLYGAGPIWYIQAPSGTTVTGVNVSDSTAVTNAITANSSNNGGNNSNWTFGAVTRYWVAGADGSWSTVANWSDSSTGTGGYAAPSANDTAVFDAGSTHNCAIDIAASIAALNILSGYDTGTVTINSGQSLIVSGAMSLAGGGFNSNGQALTVGSYSQTGGTFTAGASTITSKGDYSVTVGTYNANSSVLILDATDGGLTFTGGGYTFNNLEFHIGNTASADRTIILGAGTFTIGGYFYIDNDDDNIFIVTAAMNSPAMNITGDIDFVGSGSGMQSFLMGGGIWTVSGNVDLTGGSITAGNSTLAMNGAGKVLTGNSQTLYNLNTSNTISAGGSFTVSNVFTISSGTFDGSSYIIILSGTTGTPFVKTGAFTSSSSTIKYTGNNTTGNTSVVATTYYNLYLDNASETFAAAGNITAAGVLTINAGTFDALSTTVTLSGTGTPLVISGTFLNNSATIVYSGTGAPVNVTTIPYFNLSFTPAIPSGTYNLTGDLTEANAITGTLTIDSDATLVIRPVATDYNITAPNIVINSGGVLDATGSASTITVTDTWDNNGDTAGFVAGNSTVVLAPATSITITGNTDFYNLTSTANGKTLYFGSDDTQGVTGALTLTGQSGSLIYLKRSGGAGLDQWKINPSGTRSVSYVDVENSWNTNVNPIIPSNSVNSGNNTGWTFGKDISGTVYAADRVTPLGAGRTVAVAINGAAAAKTATTDASGNYSFTGVDFSDGDVIVFYLDGAAEYGCVVTVATKQDFIGMDIYQNKVIVRNDYAAGTGYITNANLSTAHNGDADIKYSVTSNNLTVETGSELFIWSGDTYQPQGNIITPSLEIKGTLSLESNQLNISGNLSSFIGTLNAASPIITVTGIIGAQSSPVNLNITGQASVSASGMQGDISIAINGSGTYNWSDSIPGFIYLNGKLVNGKGQSVIRQQLNEGESVLYRRELPGSVFGLNFPNFDQWPRARQVLPYRLACGMLQYINGQLWIKCIK